MARLYYSSLMYINCSGIFLPVFILCNPVCLGHSLAISLVTEYQEHFKGGWMGGSRIRYSIKNVVLIFVIR